MTAAQIFNLIVQIAQLGIQYGPEFWDEIKQLYSLLTSGTALTPEQQASADETYAKAKADVNATLKAVEEADAKASALAGQTIS